MTIGRQHKIVNNFLKGTSLLVKKWERKKESTIEKNIEAVCKILRDRKIDALYLSSSDVFLNEYVPLEECFRYYFSGFTGSTAELLITSSNLVLLFVERL